ncbi:helix-turn-helix domain-containing protein [Nocardia sp. ET3-3]|uniref:Helix-turn-helix domain-containing protein n=1 Tax=Nocardia terrae TaxID=2675851 RepID=A0A7K1VB09_9NOCA|nr:helix-turn-helix transcriptional regulator [Nocardia terrae]MVU83796.1 helix-turn-helix domain-containing protein [Nocardia terrae]
MANEQSEDTETTLPRRQLGRLLREARSATGMNLERAAALVQWSRPTLSRLERGETEKIRVTDILALCEAYGLDDATTAIARGLAEQVPAKTWWHAYGDLIPSLCEAYGLDDATTAIARGLAEQVPAKTWWHAYGDLIPSWANLYVGLESSATALTIFQSLIMHGLLQTTDYTRALDRLYFPDDTEDELDRRIRIRLQRQHILTRSHLPTDASVVLHENVLRTVVGDNKLMSAQCRHLADIGTRPNIELRVLPFRAGFPLGAALPPFTIMDFGRDALGKKVADPSQVYCEGYAGSAYLEKRTDVSMFWQAFEKLRAASLDPRASRDLLREMARRYESER